MEIDEKNVEGLETILDFTRFGMSYFNQALLHFGHGTDNAWDEALMILREVLYLPMDFDDPLILNAKLTQSEKAHCLSLFQARVTRQIPLPYLINKAYFAGFEFFCDERALIPRSPIAELIEQGLQPWLNEKRDANRPFKGLDLCCGGGSLGILCQLYLDNVEMTMSDLSEDALEVASINLDKHDLDEEVILVQSDLFAQIEETAFDFIVCNPPYVGEDEMATLPVEFTHEPEMALTCENNGLLLPIKILQEASNYLSANGFLILEVGNSAPLLSETFPDVPFHWIEFERGGEGVLFITKADLIRYFGEGHE